MTKYPFTLPYLSEDETDTVLPIMQDNLTALNDMALVLKHAHWNVKGGNFIAVHEMLDPFIDRIRDAADTVGERIVTLGGVALGTADAIVKDRAWSQYTVDAGSTTEHLKALDSLFSEVIVLMRKSIEAVDSLDLVSSNILQDVIQDLEQYQWFIRSHIN